jgi:hypothetical protein
MVNLFNRVVMVLMKYGVEKTEAVRLAHELIIIASR